MRELGRVEDAMAYIYGILCGEGRPCRWMRVSEAIRPPGE
jgi:hypothetical protein